MAMTNNVSARLTATTVQRRVERSRVPTSGETKVAIAAGLDPTRPLAKDCADYYLLSYLRKPHYVPAADRNFTSLVQELVPEFACYLDLACGGELRHASSWPYKLPPCPVLGRGNDRSLAWRDWLAWETPLYRVEYARQVFEEASWPSRNYGGEPWAEIAAVLESHLRKEISDELFLDRMWNLQHHGGVVMNKVYATEELTLVLEAHGKDDHNTLLSYASDSTKNLWKSSFDKEVRSLDEAKASLLLWQRLALGSVGL